MFGFGLFPRCERRDKKILFTSQFHAIDSVISATEKKILYFREAIISYHYSKQTHLQIEDEPGKNILMAERCSEGNALIQSGFGRVSKQLEDHKRYIEELCDDT